MANDEQPPPNAREVETVRCIIQRPTREILLLQKSDTSKAASLYEFPGGKIDEISGIRSTIDEQTSAVIQEVLEETGINLYSRAIKKLDEFPYSFEHKEAAYRRRVHMFYTRLQEGEGAVSINTTVNELGESEDKHQRHIWATVEQLLMFRQQGKLSGNTSPIDPSALPDQEW